MDESIYDERAGLEEDATMPLGKEPLLWEFARDVVTSLVSDLAVVSGERQGVGGHGGRVGLSVLFSWALAVYRACSAPLASVQVRFVYGY